MDRLGGIKIFLRVVESGSFSAVARELGTGQPAISKQVAALEERLGAQLPRYHPGALLTFFAADIRAGTVRRILRSAQLSWSALPSTPSDERPFSARSS